MLVIPWKSVSMSISMVLPACFCIYEYFYGITSMFLYLDTEAYDGNIIEILIDTETYAGNTMEILIDTETYAGNTIEILIDTETYAGYEYFYGITSICFCIYDISMVLPAYVSVSMSISITHRYRNICW
jgi:hypothetical protein